MKIAGARQVLELFQSSRKSRPISAGARPDSRSLFLTKKKEAARLDNTRWNRVPSREKRAGENRVGTTTWTTASLFFQPALTDRRVKRPCPGVKKWIPSKTTLGEHHRDQQRLKISRHLTEDGPPKKGSYKILFGNQKGKKVEIELENLGGGRQPK